MSIVRFASFILASQLLIGCAVFASHTNPVADWSVDYGHEPSKAIDNDFQSYLRTLSLDQRKSMGGLQYLTDGNGQHAIKFETGQHGTSWGHVLIYDREDKRVRVSTFVAGHYAS